VSNKHHDPLLQQLSLIDQRNKRIVPRSLLPAVPHSPDLLSKRRLDPLQTALLNDAARHLLQRFVLRALRSLVNGIWTVEGGSEAMPSYAGGTGRKGAVEVAGGVEVFLQVFLEQRVVGEAFVLGLFAGGPVVELLVDGFEYHDCS